MPYLDQIQKAGTDYDIRDSGAVRTVDGQSPDQYGDATVNKAYIASDFSVLTTYAVGDYVFYNKKLYRFTDAHTAGAWDANDVTEVTVTGEISDLSSAGIDESFTIASSAWTSVAPYTYTWQSALITSKCKVSVNFLDTDTSNVTYLEVDKVSGGVQFTASFKPTTDIQVSVHIINVQSEAITDISGDMVSTDVITGATNVDEALEDVDSRIDTLNSNIETLSPLLGYVKHGSWSSSKSLTIPMGGAHSTILFLGYMQGVANTYILFTKSNSTLSVLKLDGTPFTTGYHTFSLSGNNLVITSSAGGKSEGTFFIGAWT